MAAGGSVVVNFVFVGDKFSDTLWTVFLNLKKMTFFYKKLTTGNLSFLQRDGHFPQEKQYFLSFVGFSVPPKSSILLVKKLVPNSAFSWFFF